MQIILMEKVANLGQLGDVVDVKNGYARNFLIPTGQAKRATTASLAEFEARRAELEKVQAAKLAEAQARAEKIAGYTVQITQKAGMDGKLFGSVGSVDIADALTAQGFAVTRAEVRMPDGAFKAIGDYQVAICLHSDVTVEVTVAVLGQH